MPNTWRTPASAALLGLAVAALVLLTGRPFAAAPRTPQRLVLLAPFEGRLRDLGYQALYAARLAVAEHAATHADVQLTALDDGGTAEHAQHRAHMLRHDPTVRAVLLLGPQAAHPDVQRALPAVPTIIVGAWGTPATPHVTLLAPPTTDGAQPARTLEQAAAVPGALRCDDVCLLPGFARLRIALGHPLSNVTITTSAPTPDDAFAARYAASDPFAPPPTPLAALTYQAARALLNGEAPPQRTYSFTYDADGALRPASPSTTP